MNEINKKSFEEIFDAYKKNEATPEEIAYVEEEISKNELINDYLAENIDFSNLPNESWQTADIDNKKINRAVRRRIFTVTISVLLLVALLYSGIRYVAFPMYENQYYNPNAQHEDEFYIASTVFTELHHPGYEVNSAKAQDIGVAKYDITIDQRNFFSSTKEIYNDTLIKNKALNPSNFWNFAVGNAFYDRGNDHTVTIVDGVEYRGQREEDREMYMEELKKLPETTMVSAYISFPEDLSLDELQKLAKQSGIHFEWAAVTLPKEQLYEQIGFSITGNGYVLHKENIDTEKYPLLDLAWSENRSYTSEELTTHFTSLLKYMAEQKNFLDTFANVNGISEKFYQDALSYLETNEIKIYGAYVWGAVNDVIDFADSEYVHTIMVDEVRLSFLSR